MVRKVINPMTIKYLISGCSAAGVNLGFLYLLTDLIGIYYLLSAVLSFVVAFFVSFGLQKFWTFQNKTTEKIHRQIGAYLAVALIGLSINTFLMYSFTDIFGIHYLLSAILAGGLIALVNFFVYRFIIFKQEHPHYETLDHYTESR